MKIKTTTLTGPALDWAVAKAAGIQDDCIVIQGRLQLEGEKVARQEARVAVRWLLRAHTPPQVWAFCAQCYSPSTDPAQSRPIMDREGIAITKCNNLYFPKGNEKGDTYEPYVKALMGSTVAFGPTSLIAAMRCFVASKMGPEIEVPLKLQTDPQPVDGPTRPRRAP